MAYHLVEKDPAGYHEKHDWYVSASVINALWGYAMARLAARVWRTELGYPVDVGLSLSPPPGVNPTTVGDPDENGDAKTGLRAYELTGEFLDAAWRALADVGGIPPTSPVDLSKDTLTPQQRRIAVALQYFDPAVLDPKRMTTRIITGAEGGYDFILYDKQLEDGTHRGGLDLFVPRAPYLNADEEWKEDASQRLKDDWRERTRAEALRLYKFRETGAPPVGLPGPTSIWPKNGHQRVSIASAPTGASQGENDWMTEMAEDCQWWLTGAVYRGINDALPRITAAMWYERLIYDPRSTGVGKAEWWEASYRQRFKFDSKPDAEGLPLAQGLRELLEHRLEVGLKVPILLGKNDDIAANGWNPRDVMITDKGIVVPFPDDDPPEAEELLLAMERGDAGNPVFTASSPDRGG